MVAATVVMALACACIAFSALSGLAQPPDLKARTRQIEAAITRAEAAPREGGDPSTYVQGAICHEDPAQAAELLKARLASSAAAAGLPAPKVSIGDPNAADVSEALAPVMFQLEVSGRYDAVLAYLKLLAQGGPEIFADSLDLKSEVSVVSVKLAGRVLCSTSAA